MEHANEEAIKKHVKGYIGVFLALACLTVVTVKVSTLHLSLPLAIALALVIATTKASLVGAYFMHLLSEKKLIYWVLAITVVFFTLLMILPSWWNMDAPVVHY